MEHTVLFTALREFTTGLLHQLLVNLSGQDGQMWLGEFKKFLRKESCWVPRETVIPVEVEESVPRLSTDHLQSWTVFYQKYFGLNFDFSGIHIPDKKDGFDYLIVVGKGMSINRVYNIMKENFRSWKWCGRDLESVMQGSEQGGVKESYAFWVRDSQEADEELRDKSAYMIAEEEIDTENLLERLLHGFKYWSENKNHLDTKTITLCANSCYGYAGGDAPTVVRISDGGASVSRCVPIYRHDDLRARRAIR